MRLNVLILLICLTSVGCAGGYYAGPAYAQPHYGARPYAQPYGYRPGYYADPHRPLVRPMGGCWVSGIWAPRCPYPLVYEDMQPSYPRQMYAPRYGNGYAPGYRPAPPRYGAPPRYHR